jgi:hypothetical protein
MKQDYTKLRELFLKCLTIDSKTKDARRKEFNQAIFAPYGKDKVCGGGYQIFHNTDLDMVMEKFDKAIKLMGVNQINKCTGSGERFIDKLQRDKRVHRVFGGSKGK